MEEVKAQVGQLDEKQRKTALISVGAVLGILVIGFVFWAPSCASAKSCADLKADSCPGEKCWPVHNNFHGAGGGSGSGLGDTSVCADSSYGLGPDGTKQCYGGVNSRGANSGHAESHGWEHANQVCTDAGARLCTVAELLNEVTRGTGCQHDAEMTWSSETRDECDGHITVQGGQHRGDEACPDECHEGRKDTVNGVTVEAGCAKCVCTPRCAPDDRTHAVRCCADTEPSLAKAKCESYIGYRGPLKAPSRATNMQGATATEGLDAESRAAAAMCRSVSSCAELQKNYGGWPTAAVSENIRAGFVTNGQQPMSAGYQFGQSSANTLERSEAGVCGESSHGLGLPDEAGRSTNACWGGLNDGGGAGVSTGVGAHTGIAGTGGPDNRISGWKHALDICEGVGARLCTVDELIHENTRATGCGHDCEMVWTSQSSPQCKSNQKVVAQGGLNCGYQICPDECSASDYVSAGGETSSCACTPRCADDTMSHAVRCCADVFFNADPNDVDLTAELEKGHCHFDACVNNPDPNHPSCKIKTPHVHGGHSCPAASTSDGIHGSGGLGTGDINDPNCDNGVRVCGATSSSTLGWGGEPDRAIDGKHCSEWGDGSCTHTDAGRQDPLTGQTDLNVDGTPHGPAWWQVDLGGTASITKVDVWHRTGCGDIITDPVTGRAVSSSCNSRLEGSHIFVSNQKRAPDGKMWSVTTCTQGSGCSVCGVLHSSIGQQPEVITCGQAPTPTPGQTYAPPPPFGAPPPGQYQGRYVSISHVHDTDAGHGIGGSSGGRIITICEARVTDNNLGDCSTYSGQVTQPPPPPAPCASRKSCAQLHNQYGGWQARTSFNQAENVCGESDNGLGGCGRNQCFGGTVTGGVDLGAGVIEPPHADSSTGGWSHAEKICKDVGARLCTVAEMKSEVGRGTGCQHDGEMVWTSESCDPGLFGPDEAAHITVQGGLHRGDEACPDECTVGEAHGDCMGGEGYCEQELTRGLPTGGCHFDTCVGTDSAPGPCSIATRHVNGGGSCDISADGSLQPGSRYPWAPAAFAPPPPGQDPAWGRQSNGANNCVNGKRICGAASSSTVGWGGEPDRAIEGSITHSGAWGRNSCTHTDAGDYNERNIDGSLHGPAWWQVDLGEGALINHVDLMHRTDCCQDRLEKAQVWVSETSDYTTGVKCGPLSDHTMKPEVSQCGQIYGRYVTVAHDHAEGGGTSGGRIITLCQAKVWGVRGRVDTSLCTCTPRCAQDSLNMAVRCCADTYPVSAGASCATKEKYTGPLKPALVGGTDWWMYGLYAAAVVVAVVLLSKFGGLCLAKIPVLGKKTGGAASGLATEGLAPDAGSSIYG